MPLAIYSINIQHFITGNRYTFLVIHSKIMLELCCIIFSLRVERFAYSQYGYYSKFAKFSHCQSFPPCNSEYFTCSLCCRASTLISKVTCSLKNILLLLITLNVLADSFVGTLDGQYYCLLSVSCALWTVSHAGDRYWSQVSYKLLLLAQFSEVALFILSSHAYVTHNTPRCQKLPMLSSGHIFSPRAIEHKEEHSLSLPPLDLCCKLF